MSNDNITRKLTLVKNQLILIGKILPQRTQTFIALVYCFLFEAFFLS